MQPSSKWFPTSLQERAAWFDNFATQFAVIGDGLGFNAAEITSAAADNASMQALANIAMQVEAYADAVRMYRKVLTESGVGEPTPVFPALPAYSAPVVRPTGIFERLDGLVKRIRVAPAYSDEAGALLGIMPSTPVPVPPTDMQPTLKAVSMPGSVVQVSFVKANMNAVALETKIDNADAWSDAGRFFKSPAELLIQQNPQNLPRAVQIRARYVDGNTPVGQFSPVVTTATQPNA